MDPAILTSFYGASSALAIGMLTIIVNVLMMPTTIILLEISQQQERTQGKLALGPLIGTSTLNAFKASLIWAPLLGLLVVLLDIRVPQLIDSMLNLIGQTTSGIALFVAGLSIAARIFSLDLQIGYDIAFKMLLQPALFFACIAVLHLTPPSSREGLVMLALPTGVAAVMLALRYKRREAEVSSTLALTSLVMILTIPVAIYVAGG